MAIKRGHKTGQQQQQWRPRLQRLLLLPTPMCRSRDCSILYVRQIQHLAMVCPANDYGFYDADLSFEQVCYLEEIPTLVLMVRQSFWRWFQKPWNGSNPSILKHNYNVTSHDKLDNSSNNSIEQFLIWKWNSGQAVVLGLLCGLAYVPAKT